MGLLAPPAPPALWVLGCFSLLLWLWALCTACHRKQAQRGPARRPVIVMPVETVSARPSPGPGQGQQGTDQHSLPPVTSEADLPLPHELHRGKHHSTAPRPASMDLHPLWLEMSRGGTRLQAAASAFLPQQLPRAPPATTAAIAPSTGPEDTYSNVGLATVPRARLAASPVLWGETQLMSCAQLGSRARSTAAEHACIPRSKGPQELHGGAGVTPAAQDILYSKICKPRHRDPGLTLGQPDPQGQGASPAPRRGLAQEDAPQGLGMGRGPLENVYESIQEPRL
ncbi:lck-interacting transmembrane adapter 1-like isoform X2 [Dipodomys merriami]|uniref:lck-interacting transmembrane adapter 1-like isoform X2 n=1 Tax=Dipodomys merriami TaxID=94247 RepID=UPI003855D454